MPEPLLGPLCVLSGMPSVIFRGADFHCWILPPIMYPDGACIIKIGGAPKEVLASHDEVVRWYRNGGEASSIAQV